MVLHQSWRYFWRQHPRHRLNRAVEQAPQLEIQVFFHQKKNNKSGLYCQDWKHHQGPKAAPRRIRGMLCEVIHALGGSHQRHLKQALNDADRRASGPMGISWDILGWCTPWFQQKSVQKPVKTGLLLQHSSEIGHGGFLSNRSTHGKIPS